MLNFKKKQFGRIPQTQSALRLPPAFRYLKKSPLKRKQKTRCFRSTYTADWMALFLRRQTAPTVFKRKLAATKEAMCAGSSGHSMTSPKHYQESTCQLPEHTDTKVCI